MSDEYTTTDPGSPDAAAETAPASEDPRNREARQYRQQLRETQAERDSLRERVARFEREKISQMAAERLADPSDFADSADLDSLRDDDGEIDPDSVKSAVDALVKAKPHYRKPDRKPDPAQGSTATDNGGSRSATWADVIRPSASQRSTF